VEEGKKIKTLAMESTEFLLLFPFSSRSSGGIDGGGGRGSISLKWGGKEGMDLLRNGGRGRRRETTNQVMESGGNV
jgi:hypothetical protein